MPRKKGRYSMGLTGLQVLWLLVFIGLIVFEALTVNLVTVWFALGAAAALLTSALTGSWQIQLLVFAAVSALALLVTRPLARKWKAKSVRTNADLNIGRKGRVIVRIEPYVPGRVRIDGVDWQACSGETLEVGTLCEVLDMDGTTFLVKPVAAPQAAEPAAQTK